MGKHQINGLFHHGAVEILLAALLVALANG